MISGLNLDKAAKSYESAANAAQDSRAPQVLKCEKTLLGGLKVKIKVKTTYL